MLPRALAHDTAHSDAHHGDVFERSRIFHPKSAAFRGAVILSPDHISQRRDVAQQGSRLAARLLPYWKYTRFTSRILYSAQHAPVPNGFADVADHQNSSEQNSHLPSEASPEFLEGR